MDSGEPPDQIILGQHHPADTRKQLRLMLTHPKKLGGGEAGEGDIPGEFRQLFHPEIPVEPGALLLRSAVVPQDGGTQNPARLIQGYQAVHLAAHADPPHRSRVLPFQQLPDPQQGLPLPVRRLLFAPAGPGHMQRILPAHAFHQGPVFLHEQQLHCAGAQIHADIPHPDPSFVSFF